MIRVPFQSPHCFTSSPGSRGPGSSQGGTGQLSLEGEDRAVLPEKTLGDGRGNWNSVKNSNVSRKSNNHLCLKILGTV